MAPSTNLAFDEVPRGDGGTGATEQIARTLRDSGIDAPAGLYDEALVLARDGHLTPAAERLRMLLCLDPTDADASLLLGKILAQRGQYQEALANLDAAVTHGAVLPPGLRDRVELGLRHQITEAEEHRTRVAARERGEVHALRGEAKKLRSVNAVLELEIDELQRRVRLWSSATAITAGVAAALVLAVLLFSGEGAETEPVADFDGDALVITPTPDAVAATAGGTFAEGEISAVPADGAMASASVLPASGAISATTTTKAVTSAGTVHTVRSGDTLGSIANKYYGKSSDWPTIQKANTDQLGTGIKLSLGMKLTIPPAP